MSLLVWRSELDVSLRRGYHQTFIEQTGWQYVGVFNHTDVGDVHWKPSAHHYFTMREILTTLGCRFCRTTASGVLRAPVKCLGVRVDPEEALVAFLRVTLAYHTARVLIQVLSDHRLSNRVDRGGVCGATSNRFVLARRRWQATVALHG